MSCSRCSDNLCDPQSQASGTIEALSRGQARSRSRDRPHDVTEARDSSLDVTWIRDMLSRGRLRSSDEGYQQRLWRPSGGQSQDWAEILTSDGEDDLGDDDEDEECQEGSLFSPLVPLKVKILIVNVFDDKIITVPWKPP